MGSFHLSPLPEMYWDFKNILLLYFGNILDNGLDKILKYQNVVLPTIKCITKQQ